MDIKKKIGSRIAEARKKAGFTVKQLSEKTIDLSPSRISNWEQGTRSPGPLEVKQLSLALNVPASYLMCLVDDDSITSEYSGYMISSVLPVLSLDEIISKSKLTKLIKEKLQDNHASKLLPIAKPLAEKLGSNAFCLQIADDSMTPELRLEDYVIVDVNAKPTPGKFVVAIIDNTAVIRKYRDLGSAKGKTAYELVSLHDDWPNTIIDNQQASTKIIGTVVELQRTL